MRAPANNIVEAGAERVFDAEPRLVAVPALIAIIDLGHSLCDWPTRSIGAFTIGALRASLQQVFT
jgi:hypothetical protein